ncbi:uncharacterized protein [Littorina saxatilis]|uniref:uncharacterized protein n=1 Tax=Littorina saxatilis TaxID=31220 RepID=UPI0038B5BC11
MQDSAPTVSPEPSPLRQASSNEDHIYIDILDPDDIYDVENSGSTDGDTATEISGQRPPSSSSTHNSMAYYEIPDTTNTLEMGDVQDNYDILHPYSNDDAERQPYSQLTSHASDVTQTSGDTAHANNA